MDYIAVLTRLNRALQVWGYSDNPRDVLPELKRSARAVKKDPAVQEAWIKEQEEWVLEGDALLDKLEEVVCMLPSQGLGQEELRGLWRTFSGVQFKVQWAMAAAEVYLDM